MSYVNDYSVKTFKGSRFPATAIGALAVVSLLGAWKIIEDYVPEPAQIILALITTGVAFAVVIHAVRIAYKHKSYLVIGAKSFVYQDIYGNRRKRSWSEVSGFNIVTMSAGKYSSKRNPVHISYHYIKAEDWGREGGVENLQKIEKIEINSVDYEELKQQLQHYKDASLTKTSVA